MEQMWAYYPHQEFLQETVDGFEFDMERLALRFGLVPLREVLLGLRLRQGQKFFPHPTEVLEVLEAMATKAREQARQANPYVPDPNCKHLLPGQAWMLDKDGDPVIGECDCHKSWRGQQTTTTRDHKASAAGGD